jgi:fucose permease
MPAVGNFEITRPRNYPIPFAASFTWLAYALFVVLGVVTTLLGPTLPLLATRWSLSSAEAGSLFFWQFVASTVGTLLSGAIFARRSFRLPVLLGMALCLIGVAELVRADWNLGRFAVACYGFGLGVALPAINLAVAEANPTRRAGSVSILNFAWGIGAISGPIILRLTHGLDLFLTLLSMLIAIGLLASSISSMPEKKADSTNAAASRSDGSLWLLVPLIAVSMFLFCGIENSVAGWASSLALPHFSSAFTATTANIFFWIFFLASRAITPVLLRRVSEARLLVVSILVAMAGVLIFFFAANVPTILLACALAGTGIGPGFPLVISRISERIGAQHPTSAICFAFAGFGAATLPALVGVLGAKMAQPRAGLILPLLGLALLIPITRGLGEKPRDVVLTPLS